MTKLLDKTCFKIDINKYNPNGYCLVHIDLDDAGVPAGGTFIYANEALAKLVGKSTEELMDCQFFDIFHITKPDWAQHCYEAAYQGKNATLDDISEDGDRYYHIDIYPTDEMGYCVCIVVNIKDSFIQKTEERKTLEALVRQLEDEKNLNSRVHKFGKAMGMVYPLAISMDYKNDTYQMIEYDDFLNKTAAPSGNIDELIRIGASTVPDEKMARDFWELFNRESAIKAFERGERQIMLRHTQVGDDGKTHYMDTGVVCTEFSDERIEAISISRPIDEEAQRDQAIMDAARHVEVIDALSTLYRTIMVTDLKTHEYRVVKSAPLMKAATGGKSHGNFEDVMDIMIRYFVHPDMHEHMRTFLDLSTLSARFEDTDTVATEYKNNSNSWFVARFIVQKRDDAGKAVSVLYVSRDISSEKKKELVYREQLKSAAVEARKANISKTNFLRHMSHDIRTPLNGIVGMLHIADKYRDNKKKFDECMTKIFNSTEYLQRLVNNVLDLSKLESGEIVLESRPFNMEEILLENISVASTYAAENGIAFNGGKDALNIEHLDVIGSPVHLSRILMNIASNAIKYNRPGGSMKVYCNEFGFDGKRATYEFVCEDTGLGMSEEFTRQAFDPFSQEGKETVTGFAGSGLGLSIVKEITEAMGGTVNINSREGKGTTIRILLPLKVDMNHGQKEKQDKLIDEVDVAGCSVLLVEDNELNMEIAKVMLEEKGLVITEARNGKEAVDIFNKSEPYTFDYIFMDMMMPVMNGLEATRKIRGLEREDAGTVPIIAMTANAFGEDRRECIKAGMNDHISKPVDMKLLDEVLRRFAK